MFGPDEGCVWSDCDLPRLEFNVFLHLEKNVLLHHFWVDFGRTDMVELELWFLCTYRSSHEDGADHIITRDKRRDHVFVAANVAHYPESDRLDYSSCSR